MRNSKIDCWMRILIQIVKDASLWVEQVFGENLRRKPKPTDKFLAVLILCRFSSNQKKTNKLLLFLTDGGDETRKRRHRRRTTTISWNLCVFFFQWCCIRVVPEMRRPTEKRKASCNSWSVGRSPDDDSWKLEEWNVNPEKINRILPENCVKHIFPKKSWKISEIGKNVNLFIKLSKESNEILHKRKKKRKPSLKKNRKPGFLSFSSSFLTWFSHIFSFFCKAIFWKWKKKWNETSRKKKTYRILLIHDIYNCIFVAFLTGFTIELYLWLMVNTLTE